MKLRIPAVNGINFAFIFSTLYVIFNSNFFGSSIYSGVKGGFSFLSFLMAFLMAFVIGFIVGIIIEIFFKDRHIENTEVHRHLPDKVSTRLIIIPSVLLLILIGVSALFIAGANPFSTIGQSTIETIEPEPEVNETEEVEEIIEYSGKCEEKTLSREYNNQAKAYSSVEEWNRIGFLCNEVDDCVKNTS